MIRMINLKEFKQSVLQKAMQGKLTKQLPSDGDARDLLVKIVNHKRDLVQAGKLKGYSKPLPPVTDKEIPFKIPSNWEWTKLGNVCKLINGRAYKKRELLTDSSLTPVLRVGNLFTDKQWYYSNLKLPSKNYAHKGDLLYSWSASFGPRIWDGSTVIFHYHIWKVNFFKEYLNENYLYYVFLNVTHLAKFESHGTSMQHITMYNMNRIPIPLPPLSEQKRIVAKIHKCFLLADTIQKERELNQKFAHDMKQSLLLEAMKGKLTQQLPNDGNADDLLQSIQQKKQQLIKASKIRKYKKLPPISKDEIPFKIPKNWKWVRLGNISLIISGRDIPKRKQSKINDDNTIPYITGAGNFISSKIVTHTYLNKHLASVVSFKDDLLITVKGTVGELAFNPFCQAHIARQVIALRFISNIAPQFIYALLLLTRTKLSNKSKSIIPGIKRADLENLLVPVPPLSEQNRIIVKLNNLI